MRDLFKIDLDGKIIGGSHDQNWHVPNKIVGNCAGCGAINHFPVPTQQKPMGGVLAFGSRCADPKCASITNVFVLFAEGPSPRLVGEIWQSRPPGYGGHRALADLRVKCDKRLGDGDYEGVVTLCNTILERFLKLEICANGGSPAGDVRALFKQFAKSENLDDAGATEKTAPLLRSIAAIVSQFYDLANKAGDRHAEDIVPNREDAVFTLQILDAFLSYCEDKARGHSGD